jgi:membrane associated rhomboid family serine protease
MNEERQAQGPVEVYRSHSWGRVREYGLVLQAMQIPHAVERGSPDSVLFVPPERADGAREQLALYDRENRGWPRAEDLPEVLGESAAGVAAWFGVLLVFYALERNRAFGLNWWDGGKSVAVLIQDGEWWRAVTSLTLHDDMVHLAGNIVFGALFVGIVCQVFGTGLGLFAVLLSGAAGNTANAWIQGDEFSAIGASTAVFGALGILGGQRWQSRTRLKLQRKLIPLLACVFLFGYHGLGGERPERVDVLGHALGFACGLVLGIVHGRWGSGWHAGARGQSWWLAGTVAALALAWWLAIGR